MYNSQGSSVNMYRKEEEENTFIHSEIGNEGNEENQDS
jgi:hypothetical protein